MFKRFCNKLFRRELALAETEVFKVLDQIEAEETSGNLYR